MALGGTPMVLVGLPPVAIARVGTLKHRKSGGGRGRTEAIAWSLAAVGRVDLVKGASREASAESPGRRAHRGDHLATSPTVPNSDALRRGSLPRLPSSLPWRSSNPRLGGSV
ncbi:hypothetical protein TIFTF001_004621 [Ficus carica]|uniref:Uncharacterized protein n=1 Tax=Ficus carica TaxID=3494 RepID=A0AA88DD92_FICCA|nr:hypothetical protein TIFTF001_004621 [Ficus carica]